MYVNVLFAVALGLSLGFAVSKGISAFHVRNVKCAAISGIVVFICAYVSHWFFYLAAYGMTKLSEVPGVFETAFRLFENPLTALKEIKLMNDAGWLLPGASSMDVNIMVDDWALWAIWMLEAVCIGYFSLAAPMRQAGAPYSERRRMWMDAVELPKPVAFIENAEAFKDSLSLGDYGALMMPLGVRSASREPRCEKYAVVTMYPDSWDPYVSVSNVTAKIGKKWRDLSAKKVVEYLKVPAEISLEIKDALS
jgi:hypothetical protein